MHVCALRSNGALRGPRRKPYNWDQCGAHPPKDIPHGHLRFLVCYSNGTGICLGLNIKWGPAITKWGSSVLHACPSCVHEKIRRSIHEERPLIHECLPEVFPSYFRCRIGDLMGSVKKLFIEAGWEVGGEGHSLVTRPITQI